jgi:predicted extracellular nuclease
VPSWPEANVDEFSVATFNTYNFDSEDSAAKQTKVVNSIAQLNGPAFIALQEIEGDDMAFMTDFLAELALAGYSYDYAYSHSDVGGHGVSLLWNTDIVTDVTWSTGYQSCSPYGSSSSTTYDDYCDGIPGEYPTFSRRPVVLTGPVELDNGNQEVVVIANHFKSKLGGTSADMRRLAQGTFVNVLVSNFIANGSESVIVMGDLNDFEDSPPLEALYANDVLTNTWFTYPAEPYSYIYKGVSQVLDHILVSPAMNRWLDDMGPLHMNADFPYNPYTGDDSVVWRTSDHDLVAATLSLPSLEVDFSSNTPVTIGEEAILIDGASPLSYTWDFGDGTAPVTDMNPTHMYTATGTFTVTLMVSNWFESVTVSHEFVVDPMLIYFPTMYNNND